MTTYDHTRRACYTGYVTQAIVNNLAPLLFIVFQTRYQLPLEMLGRLVLLNFATQLVTDIVAVKFVDRTGYRVPLVLAHILSALGLMLLAVAPAVSPSHGWRSDRTASAASLPIEAVGSSPLAAIGAITSRRSSCE